MFFLGVRGFLFGNFRILVIEGRSEAISRNSKFILGILDFYPRNSRIPVILGLDPRISIGNSSLMNFRLRNSLWEFSLGILD